MEADNERKRVGDADNSTDDCGDSVACCGPPTSSRLPMWCAVKTLDMLEAFECTELLPHQHRVHTKPA